MLGCIIETHIIGPNPALDACTQRVSLMGRLLFSVQQADV